MLLAGCATGPTVASRGSPSAQTAPPVTSGTSETSPRLDEQVQGKVVSVNTPLRFVVMDFAIRRMPVVDQRLNVYRQSQKVGEVKVTGPTLDTTSAGDIIAGEARVGDEVRED
jgi:hypothetical protein